MNQLEEFGFVAPLNWPVVFTRFLRAPARNSNAPEPNDTNDHTEPNRLASSGGNRHRLSLSRPPEP